MSSSKFDFRRFFRISMLTYFTLVITHQPPSVTVSPGEPKPYTLNTLNPKPYTLNPKP